MQNPIERIVSYLTPSTCIRCGTISSLLCDECVLLLGHPDRCFVCKKPSLGGLTCSKCRKKMPIDAQCLMTSHSGIGRTLIYRTKYGASREGADIMGQLLALRLPYLDEQAVVVPIPTTHSRRRERSFDQASRIARAIARKSGHKYIDCIVRTTKSHQIGSSRNERIAHMKDAFSVLRPKDIVDKTVILVDDVVTTGATMESAARELKAHGAKRIIATYFARAE